MPVFFVVVLIFVLHTILDNEIPESGLKKLAFIIKETNLRKS